MAETRDFRSILVKAARIALVFALVFYTSLRVELLVAFADELSDSVTVDDVKDHAKDELTDLVVYQYTVTADGASWQPVLNAAASKKDKKATVEMSTADAAKNFVVAPVWDKKYPEGYEKNIGLKKVTSASYAEWAKLDSGITSISQSISDKKNVLTVTPKAATDKPITVKCSVDKELGGLSASFDVVVTEPEPEPEPEPSTSSSSSTETESTSGSTESSSSGSDSETSSSSSSESSESSPSSSSSSSSSSESSSSSSSSSEASDLPEITSVDILDKAGKEFDVGKAQVAFEASEVPVEYQFQARVKAKNAKLDGGTYESPKNGSLSEYSDKVLDDLEWSVAPANEGSSADDATIDDKGVLKVAGEGTFTVTCVARVHAASDSSNASGQQMSEKVTVVVGNGGEKQEEPEDPQGESHPQTQLRITSDVEFLKATGATGSSSSSSSSSSGSDSTTAKVNKTYELSGLEKMQGSSEEKDFSMYVGGAKTKISGAGVDLLTLIKDAFDEAGVDFESASTYLDSVDFIDYQGKLTSIAFNTVKTTPMLVALKSAVSVPASTSLSTKANDAVLNDESETETETEGENPDGTGDVSGDGSTATSSSAASGDGTTSTSASTATSSSSTVSSSSSSTASSSASSSSSSSSSADGKLELVDNTRFRILFDSTAEAFDADSLRYINTIQLNGIAQPAEEDDIAVRIEYKPVPMGVDAEFIAVPTHEIKGSWNCIWEVWPKGESASRVLEDENGQTLRVATSEKTVGNRYRVTIDNEATTGAEAHLKGTSAWVELEAAEDETGPTVVLSYTPPRAGDLAIFRSSVYDYGGDVSKLEYAWQWSNDGGASWNTIAGETNPTLKLPTTEPSSSGSDESSSGPLYFIRVLVTTSSESDRSDYAPKDGWPMKSNVQPLTVRTGDEEFVDEVDVVDDDDGKTDGDKKKGGETKPEKQKDQEKPKPKPKPREREVNITVDNASTPSSTPSETVKPADQSLPSELYVNDDITDKIIAQEATEAAEMEATTPGARWTELKTLDGDTKNLDSVLGDNPFAPFAIPVGLGFTVAGGLEKLLAFRRQL